MAVRYLKTVTIGDDPITVEADSFLELLQATSGLEQLDRDSALLRAAGSSNLRLQHRNYDANDFYELAGADGKKVGFGRFKTANIPSHGIALFPTGLRHYFDPELDSSDDRNPQEWAGNAAQVMDAVNKRKADGWNDNGIWTWVRAKIYPQCVGWPKKARISLAKSITAAISGREEGE